MKMKAALLAAILAAMLVPACIYGQDDEEMELELGLEFPELPLGPWNRAQAYLVNTMDRELFFRVSWSGYWFGSVLVRTGRWDTERQHWEAVSYIGEAGGLALAPGESIRIASGAFGRNIRDAHAEYSHMVGDVYIDGEDRRQPPQRVRFIAFLDGAGGNGLGGE